MKKSKHKYIIPATDDQPAFLVEAAASFCNRKNLTFNNSSNLRKLARMARVRKRGLVKTVATAADIKKYEELT